MLHRHSKPVSVGWPLVPQPGRGRRLGAREHQRTGQVVFEQMFQLFNYQTVVLLLYCGQNRVQIVKGKKMATLTVMDRWLIFASLSSLTVLDYPGSDYNWESGLDRY